MLKRLVNWLRSKRHKVGGLPEGYHYTRILTKNPLGKGYIWKTVIREHSPQPTVTTHTYTSMSRQDWLTENGHTDPKKTGREWLVSVLPDECVFL